MQSTESTCYPYYNNANISEYVLSTMGEPCPSPSILYPTAVIYGLILLLGLVGNVCTCIVIIANKHMHNPTNYYLLSLAISDILILILGLPMELYIVTDLNYPYRFPEVVCKLRAFLVEFTSYASILTICLFSVERWIAICFPLKAQLFSGTTRSVSLIVCCWFISFCFSLPVVFVVKINRLPLPDFAQHQTWTHLVSGDGLTVIRTEYCAMDVNNLDNQKNIIYFAFFVFFLIPGNVMRRTYFAAIVITVMYGHIAIRLNQTDALLGFDDKQRRGNKRSILRVLVSVVITFFLFWLPFHMQRLLSIFLNERASDEAESPAIQFLFTLVFYISGYCYYSNSACNPILYNILSEKYRRAFCKTILGDRVTKKLFPRWRHSHTFLTHSRGNTEIHRMTRRMTTQCSTSRRSKPDSWHGRTRIGSSTLLSPEDAVQRALLQKPTGLRSGPRKSQDIV